MEGSTQKGRRRPEKGKGRSGQKPQTARQAAALALLRMEGSGAYSHLLLSALDKGDLPQRERSMAKALVYSVLERQITLDAILASHCTRDLARLDDGVRVCLRLGLCQLAFFDGVEDFAAVHETVELTKWLGYPHAAGLVNGVLRSILRQGLRWPEPDGTPQSLSLAYSCPQWLVEKWMGVYGLENTENILRSAIGQPPLYIRVNTLRTTTEALAARLETEGVKVVAVREDLPGCLHIHPSTGGLEELASFREGLFHVQDSASQQCVKALAPKPGERILDLCAAPGGKSFTIAQYMEDCGWLLSCDLHQKRVGLVMAGAERLGITILQGKAMDAAVVDSGLGEFHGVLCDVPCSGFGSMRRKPEIKYKSLNEIKNIPIVQEKILKAGANYVLPGGRLVYSTCTLLPEENQEVVQKLLAVRRDYTLAWERTFFGGEQDSDGFYIALLTREGEG